MLSTLKESLGLQTLYVNADSPVAQAQVNAAAIEVSAAASEAARAASYAPAAVRGRITPKTLLIVGAVVVALVLIVD